MNKSIHSIIFSLTLFSVALLPIFSGFGQDLAGERRNEQTEGYISVSGATTIQSIAERAAEIYIRTYGGRVEVQGGGSGTGIHNVISGASQVGMVSRSLTAAETEQVSQVLIGFDALVFITNAANPLEAITREQVIDLFSGTITNWEALNSHDRPVVLVSKEIGRATLDLFEAYTGLHHPDRPAAGPAGRVDDKAFEIASNLEGITITGGMPNAISYASLGSAEELIRLGMPIKILTLEGIAPSRESVISEKYPIIRELNLAVHPSFNPLNEETAINRFLEIFSSEEVRDFLNQNGFVPAAR